MVNLRPLLSDQNWVPALVIFWQASKQQQISKQQDITFTPSSLSFLSTLENSRGGNVFQLAQRIEEQDRSKDRAGGSKQQG